MTHRNPHKSSQNHFIPDEIHGKTILTTVSDKKIEFNFFSTSTFVQSEICTLRFRVRDNIEFIPSPWY